MTTWMAVMDIEEIPSPGARVVRTDDGDIAIFRTSEGALFALRDRCPHKGGPLSQGLVYGEAVACPLHNWSIDLSSGQALPPDKGCVPKIPVRVNAGRVELDLALSTPERL